MILNGCSSAFEFGKKNNNKQSLKIDPSTNKTTWEC